MVPCNFRIPPELQASWSQPSSPGKRGNRTSPELNFQISVKAISADPLQAAFDSIPNHVAIFPKGQQGSGQKGKKQKFKHIHIRPMSLSRERARQT